MHQEISVVEDLSHDGQGIVRADGKAYFVPGALPGEKISFLPGARRRGKFEARLVDILSPSPHRTDPLCRYFGTCGGCSMQHLDPREQVVRKQRTLTSSLQQIGKVQPERMLEPIRGATWHYRRKARLGVKLVPKKGGILVGFRERRSRYITSLLSCETLDRRIARLLPALHAVISDLGNNHRIPQVEVAAGDNSVALVFRHLESLGTADHALLERFADSQEISVYSQPAGPGSLSPVYPDAPRSLSYRHESFGLELQFGPLDFVQVHPEVNQVLVRQVVALLDPRESDNIADLFCGLGNFTLAIGKAGAGVTGVESESSLVQQGRKNAVLNRLDQVRFQRTDLYQEAAGLLDGPRFNKFLLDPPRSGADQVVCEVVPAMRPERLVYVSCNPATLARDADVLVNRLGYRMSHAGTVDMFPGTAHIECLAVFDRR